MRIYPAYLTGTHPYSFRTGEPAEIIGVKFIKPSGLLTARCCYHIRFKDGEEDYTPMSDGDNYTISTGPIIDKITSPPRVNTNTIL